MKFKIFENIPALDYGISTKHDGAMLPTWLFYQESHTIGDISKEEFRQRKENTAKYIREKTQGDAFIPILTHSKKVVAVSKENIHKEIEADGAITNLANLALVITAADCFPLYFIDQVKKIIGLAHAGWRGTAANITKEMINKFIKEFDSQPKDILLGIGPGVQKCHFEVGEDVKEKFMQSGYSRLIEPLENKKYIINLLAVIEHQARESGITQIESCGECTYCMADKYFSFRRDKKYPPRVMVAYIKIRTNINIQWSWEVNYEKGNGKS